MDKSAIQEIINFLDRSRLEAFEEEDNPYIVVPAGHKVENLRALLDLPPAYVQQDVEAESLDGFLKYFARQCGPKAVNAEASRELAVIFLSPVAYEIKAIFDYHGYSPGRCSHVLTYAPLWSVGFRQLSSHSDERMSQLNFAKLLRRLVPLVQAGEGMSLADLLEMSRALTATERATFSNTINFTAGGVSFRTEGESKIKVADGEMELPQQVKFSLPLLDLGAGHVAEQWEVQLSLDFAVKDGKILVTYMIDRFEELKRSAFAQVQRAIEEAFKDVDLIVGRP